MRITLSAITTRKKLRLYDEAMREFAMRQEHYATIELTQFADVEALQRFRSTREGAGRLVLLDARGRTMSSDELASWIGRERDGGAPHLHFAIGPADGWSDEMRRQADLVLSFGPMTFPHELARVMLAEQIYRAFTILGGHPYHAGH